MQWVGVELSNDDYKMLYVSEQFAKDFIILADNTDANYLFTQLFAPGAEQK